MPFHRALPALGAAASDRLARATGRAAQIHLPADHYLHRGAPTEWWWNIGTLRAGERIFGFEITASCYRDRGVAFSQIMLTDVANRKHYQRTAWFVPPLGVDPDNWAEHDVTRDWHVGLGSVSSQLSVIDVTAAGSGYSDLAAVEIGGGGGSQAVAYPVVKDGKIASITLVNPGRGYSTAPTIHIKDLTGKGASARAVPSYVTMDAAWGDPTQGMAVTALLVDVESATRVTFDLKLTQQGAPFLVLGSGVLPLLPAAHGTQLQTNNFYYSLTRLQASGSIAIDGESFAVTGLTWMDHEYGAFGSAEKPVKWILQDMQLDNGWCISNFALPPAGAPLQPGQTLSGFATLQNPEGTMSVDFLTSTKLGKPWKSPNSGITYFMELQVTLADRSHFTVTSLIEPQEFFAPGSYVYEGVASVTGSFRGRNVTGTGWNEQALPQPTV